jgi:hypothetical protein
VDDEELLFAQVLINGAQNKILAEKNGVTSFPMSKITYFYLTNLLNKFYLFNDV